MTTWQIVLAGALMAGLALALLITIIMMSRHRKSGVGELELLGATGVVETDLEPEGSVLVRGELWRARLRSGGKAERGRRVRVVGAGGQYLLEVEPA